MNYDRLAYGRRVLREELKKLRNTNYMMNKEFVQHGTTSVYQHCVSVAYRSVIIAARYNINVDMRSMVRGALLHDYFLLL